MKILFDHPIPFQFAHGGFQVQIEQSKAALQKIGLEVEWLRWWDDRQRGDLIHHFGVASSDYLLQARTKGVPTVMTTLFTATCNRPKRILRLQGMVVRTILGLPFGSGVKRQLEWPSFNLCNCNVVGLEAERQVLDLVYHVPHDRTAIVPLGLSDAYVNAGPSSRTLDALICVGTITSRKNCVELAELARRAEVPVLFVGKPYTESDPYWLRFRALIDDHRVRYQPHLGSEAEMITLLHKARGAVIMSRFENWCIAAHESAACGLPLLLPPLPWARERFGTQAHYFSGRPEADIEALRTFYSACPNLTAPQIRLYSWDEVAKRLMSLYQDLLTKS